MPNEIKHFYEFGDFRLDAEKRILWRKGSVITLPPKAAEVLVALVERRGDVLERGELLDRVWKDTFVEEGNLSYTISNLRRTLGKNGKNSFIQTVPRRGYRFTVDIKDAWDETDYEIVFERSTISETVVEESRLSASSESTLQPAVLPFQQAIHLRTIVVGLALLAIATAVVVWRFTGASAERAVSIRSIVVLPLDPLNDDQNDRALGFGFADALITQLGTIKELRIVSASSVRQYAESSKGPVVIGSELGVNGVLEGTLQRSNGKIRVTLRLIRVSDGTQIWSGMASDSENDVFRLQDAIAFQAAQAMNLNIVPRQTSEWPTANIEAYHLFLKGDYLFRLRGESNAALSIPFFKQAVSVDPNFAQGWAALAAALAVGTEIEQAEANLSRAIGIDPDLAEAYATRGFINMFHYWKWSEAERDLERAVLLDPNSLQAHHWRGVFLSLQGRFEEATVELHRALELDPTSLNITSDLGQIYYLAKEYEQAEQYCLKALAIDPEYGMAHGYLRYVYENQGSTEKAFDQMGLSSCGGVESDDSKCWQTLRTAFDRGGLKRVYEKIRIELFDDLRNGRGGTHSKANLLYGIAITYLRLGEHEKALDYLHQSFSAKQRFETMNFTFPYLKVDPQFDALRGNLHFQELIRKL